MEHFLQQHHNNMKNMSKKGQGLGFIAVIVLVALLIFIFRYHTETYSFIMTAGDHQAHLVTGYVETEKAKLFAQTSLRQAAYEELWNEGVKSCDFSSICNDNAKKEVFLANTSSTFDMYTSMYTSTTELLDTSFPSYLLETRSCTSNKIEIDAFGFEESCLLNANFPFPKYPCEDFNETTDPKCTDMKYTDGKAGACKWDAVNQLCTEKNPAPDCESIIDSGSCSGNCSWQKSYAEEIGVLSASLVDYQFRIDSNAHIVGTVDCKGFEAFMAQRKVAIKPRCALYVQPEEAKAGTTFTFNINYKDDVPEPKELKLTIKGPITIDATKTAGNITGSQDAWSYSTIINANGTYTVSLNCTDSADQTTSARPGKLKVLT